MKSRNIGIGCLGLAAIFAFALVFGSEGVLALIRTRNVSVSISLIDANSTTPLQGITPTPKPQILAQTLLADGSVSVHIVWNYKIGPRFPTTIVASNITDTNGVLVASDSFTIDCGTASLDCSGDTQRLLKPANGANWPSGNYKVDASYTYAGLPQAVHPLNTADFHVG